MKNDWKFFPEVSWSDESIKQYHIDTRDFHCLTNTEEYIFEDIETLKKYGNRFFFSADEAFGLLSRYFQESGGHKDWRFFFIEGMEDWRLKYIRMYRTKYGILICDKDHYAIKREILNGKVGEDRH